MHSSTSNVMSLRLHFSNSVSGAAVGECNATLGIDSIPIITTPLREGLRVDVCFDDQVTF